MFFTCSLYTKTGVFIKLIIFKIEETKIENKIKIVFYLIIRRTVKSIFWFIDV